MLSVHSDHRQGRVVDVSVYVCERVCVCISERIPCYSRLVLPFEPEKGPVDSSPHRHLLYKHLERIQRCKEQAADHTCDICLSHREKSPV